MSEDKYKSIIKKLKKIISEEPFEGDKEWQKEHNRHRCDYCEDDQEPCEDCIEKCLDADKLVIYEQTKDILKKVKI